MTAGEEVVIDVSSLYDNVAKLVDLQGYERKVQEKAGEGNVVILTGQGPIWLYLRVAHTLHGKVRRLIYRAPATGDVVIFDHDPF